MFFSTIAGAQSRFSNASLLVHRKRQAWLSGEGRLRAFAARARQEGWSYYELPTGHDAQAEMPETLSDLLLETAVEINSSA
jgi:hypothetical protein